MRRLASALARHCECENDKRPEAFLCVVLPLILLRFFFAVVQCLREQLLALKMAWVMFDTMVENAVDRRKQAAEDSDFWVLAYGAPLRERVRVDVWRRC